MNKLKTISMVLLGVLLFSLPNANAQKKAADLKGNQFDRTDKIKVAFYFENKEGGTFDFDYFREVHIPLVIKLQKQYGLLSIEIEKGIAGETEDAPIPNVAVATLIFKSFDLLLQSDPVADELNADVPKFTNIKPVIQVSKIIEVQSAK